MYMRDASGYSRDGKLVRVLRTESIEGSPEKFHPGKPDLCEHRKGSVKLIIFQTRGKNNVFPTSNGRYKADSRLKEKCKHNLNYADAIHRYVKELVTENAYF